MFGWKPERLRKVANENGGLKSLVPVLGKSLDTIRNYARGDSIPSFVTGYRIARHFDVNPDWLAGLRKTPGHFPKPVAAT